MSCEELTRHIEGGRKAQKDAKKNAIWKVDQSSTRKRTASTAKVPEIPAKKAKETEADGSDDEAVQEAAPAQSKGKAKESNARKYAVPTIIDSDSDAEPEPAVKPGESSSRFWRDLHLIHFLNIARRIDFTKLPGNSKSKALKGPKATPATQGKSNAGKTVPAKPTKIVAGSPSEDETASSEESEEEADSEEVSDDDDDIVNVEEFIAEVPQMVSARSGTNAKSSSASIEKSAAGNTREGKKDAQALFDSGEEYEVIKPIAKKLSKSKAQPVPDGDADSSSDDSMPDAPARRRPLGSDVEMSDVSGPTQHRSRRASMASSHSSAMSDASELSRSRRSSVGSVHSSASHRSVPASEIESDDESEQDVEAVIADAPPPKGKKARKVSAARQKQANAEKPEIKPAVVPAAARGKASVDTSSRPESSWDISARLVLPAPNKDIGLTAQDPELQEVLRGAMATIKIFMLFIDAYPMMASRAGFGRPHMIRAAEARPTAVHILARLRTDPTFGTILAPIPLDRMNILRGNMKRCAVSCILAYFGLAGLTPDQVKLRVEELLKDHRYIFPTTAGKLQLDEPFRHGSISYVLTEELFSNNSFVTQNSDRFPARLLTKPNERELPDAMVALAATAVGFSLLVYAALVEYRVTGRRQTIAFTEDAYEDTYRNHISTLEDSRKTAPKGVHRILHAMFNEVTDNNNVVHTTSGSSSTLIQLVDVPSP
ncbi:hypothetical protein C8R45DRAFT_1188836 [Mycena sanguinolenta]|nr:hypothetical protein C8R45DRAFT_1188836 [Mycena sanguinolenta]